MKIKKKDILYFVLMFFFIEPAFFQVKPYIHNVFLAMQIISFMMLVFIYIIKREKPSKIIVILWLLLIELCVACHFGLGNIKTTMAAYVSYIGLSMWIDLYIREDKKKCINMLIFILDAYVIINFLSMLIYPNGMYISQSFQNTPYICWFLGYKNPQIRLLLPYVVILFVRDSIFYKKIKFYTYIKLSLVALASVILKSSTGILGVFIFIVLNVLFSGKKQGKLKNLILRIFNVKNVYYILVVVNILIIFFSFQKYFSFLIVNILHKNLDLTDRIFVWQKVIPVIKNNFILGQGIMYAELSRSVIGASHAHNYFLNTFYNGGLIAFILISIIWIGAGIKSIESKQSLGVRYLKFMTIIFLIMGITESLTSTVLLYPILTLLYYSNEFERIECVEGDKCEKY